MIRARHSARVACAIGLLLAATPVAAQDARSVRVDSIFTAFASAATPGCAAGVILDGRLVHNRGYGTANLDHGIALDGRSVFYLASVSKQFTAAAIALAEADGYLSVDDDVRTHIPELPEYAARISIRQLVHHTSGLRDYLTLITLSGRRADDHWSDAALLGLIARQRALNFEPGSEYLYSNTGYVLLAEIVKRATGRSLRAYAAERIFRPLGMLDTHFHDDARQIVPRRVVGYSREGERWRVNHWFTFDKVGDGGLYSTVEDLARWDENFYSARVGGQALLARMHERGVLAGGDTNSYAFGLVFGRYRGLDIVEHGGSLAGFRTHVLRVPAARFGAIVLCNSSAATPSQLTRRIADVYLANRMREPAPAPSSAPPAAAATPAASDDAMPLHELAGLAGAYHSDELDAVYRLELVDGLLVLHRGESTRLLMRATGVDELAAPGNAVLRFRRENGVITGFVLDAGRVRGIEFVRR
jgi:CubicO group peptidase (beta-lactamase class C family)